jgi:AcrR family transcriptional regulator
VPTTRGARPAKLTRVLPGGRSNPADTNEGGKSARTRERVLDAAAQVLSRKGYAGTRLSDIAEVAELQTPTLYYYYYYYSSREELIEAVIRRGQARAQDHVEAALAALPPETPAMDKICLAVEEHLRAVLHLSDYTTAAIRNLGQLPDDMRKGLQAEQARYGSLWRRLFEEARERNEIRPELDLHAAQLLVIGALNWAPEWWSARRVSIDTVVATARSITRHGLSAEQQ